MKLTIMCGLPESGKTTKASVLAEETGATLVKHDSYYRRAIGNSPIVTKEMLNNAMQFAFNDIKSALLRGEDVIYDAVNTTKASRERIKSACGVDGCEYVCVYMETPLEICQQRDHGGWSTIFSRGFEPPTADEGFELIICHDGF